MLHLLLAAPPVATPPVATPPVAGAPAAVPAGTRDFAFAPAPAPVAEVCDTIVEAVLQQSPTLGSILQSTTVPQDLVDVLMDPTLNVTVLLPPEEDLMAIASAQTADPGITQDVWNVISVHIITDALSSMDLLDMEMGEVPTLNQADTLTFDTSTGGVVFTVNNVTAMVTEADLDGCAGMSVIHKIDSVLTDMEFAAADISAEDRETVGADPDGSGAFDLSAIAPVVGVLSVLVALLA